MKRRILALLATLLAVLMTTGSMVMAPTAAQATTESGSFTALSPGANIAARFGGTKLDKKRVVVLLRNGVQVSTAKMTSKGTVEFPVQPEAGVSYQAVAKAFTYKSKSKKVTAPEVATPAQSVGWTKVFSDDFNALDTSVWYKRLTNSYTAEGRLCAAPQESRAQVSSGTLKLTAVKVTNSDTINRVSQNARAVQAAKAGAKGRNALANVTKTKSAYDSATSASAKKKAKKAYDKAVKALNKIAPGCPNGVYENGMISTERSGIGVASGRPGIIEARIKFPTLQAMHGSAWMQSGNLAEIDMIESYGKGRGITSVIHQGGKRYPASAPYVLKSATKKAGWWKTFHNYSVEWNANEIIFRVDGVQTKRLTNKNMDKANYFLVLSLLTSDWETNRQKKFKSGTMEVDWVRIWTR